MAEWKVSIKNRSVSTSSSDDEGFPAPPPMSDPIPIGSSNRNSFPEIDKSQAPYTSFCQGCESCERLYKHKWRKVCVNCNCDPDVHDMPVSELIDTYKKNRMSLHDNNQNVILHDGGDSDHYMWIPAGLDNHLVEDYMASLPRNRVPHFKNPDGIAYHNKQLIHQIPLQDSNFENVKSLKDDERHIFNAFKRERDEQMDSGKVLVADDDYDCTGCKKSIHRDDLLVNAPSLGSEANWHPGCFQCSQCEELLADLIYCHKDGVIYCVRHFGDQLKPRCCMCDELIFSGEYVRTDEKSYHANHFVCNLCERGLTGEQHLVDNGLPVCIACYDDKYASICHMCKKTIGVDEEDVIYDDEHWHDHCLVCSLCKCRLSGTSFVIRDDNFLCSECYQKTDDKRCKTCRKGFEPGAKRLELNGEFWHDTCFVCDLCKSPITSKKFIQHEGSQVCCPCFDHNFAKRCDKCKEILREGGVACGGAFFHRDCFQCDSCQTSIANQAFQQKDGNRYCMPCYKQRYAKQCAGCGSYIVNGEYYTVDSDSWHKECFKCEVCNKVLQQQTFVQENGKVKLVCENCL